MKTVNEERYIGNLRTSSLINIDTSVAEREKICFHVCGKG